MTTFEPLSAGTKVVYYGSLPERYGTWTVVGPCGSLERCERCAQAFDDLWEPWYWGLRPRDRERAGELFDRQFGHLWPRYELENENGLRLLCVSRSSITPINLPDGSADMPGRTDAENITAHLVEAGCVVDLPDEPIDGMWRLTITGTSWTATVHVPVEGGPKTVAIEAADPGQAAAFAELARSLGCEEQR
ncbi:hypothetical protein AB0J43_22475 [Nonomuraea fuscirosea]